jgi:hypothetical protein
VYPLGSIPKVRRVPRRIPCIEALVRGQARGARYGTVRYASHSSLSVGSQSVYQGSQYSPFHKILYFNERGSRAGVSVFQQAAGVSVYQQQGSQYTSSRGLSIPGQALSVRRPGLSQCTSKQQAAAGTQEAAEQRETQEYTLRP